MAISLVSWAYSSAQFRDAEGLLAGSFCLPVSVGIGLVLLAELAVGRLRVAAFWFVVALVGQAVALQLIEAGPSMKYQHYVPLPRLLRETHPLLLTYLVAQSVLVLVGLRARWSSIRLWIARTFKPWQILAISLVFVLSSATVSPDTSTYFSEVVLAAFIQAIQLGNLVLVVWAIPESALVWCRAWLGRVFLTGWSGANPQRGVDPLVVIAALWVAVFAATLGLLAYERHPHIPDEVAYLYQARFLASGALTLPAPAVPDAFGIYLMQFDGERWYPSPPIGWPAVLALGVLVNAPWLVNPVLAALNVLLTYLFLSQIYERRTARLAVLLLCVSPWHVFMAMNFMTHTFTLTCALVAAVAVARARKSGGVIWPALAGIAVGVTGLIRPLDGYILGGLIGLWAIGLGGSRLGPRSLLAFALAAALVSAIVLPYNAILSGDPFVFPIMAYTDQIFGRNSNAYGFGADRGMGWAIDPLPGHGPIDALINANLNTFAINIELFGWSTGSLFLIAIAVFAGAITKSDRLMLAVIVAIFTGYFFYYFSGGPDFGARYWFLMLVPTVALTARGIQVLERACGSAQPSSVEGGARPMAAVVCLGLLALVNFFPWRAIDKYHHYLGMRPGIVDLARENDFAKSLVLIRTSSEQDFASAAIYNPLDLRSNAPVYAWDRSPEVRASTLAAYSDRPVWIVDGPTRTGAGFKVSAGPLDAAALVAAQ